MPRKQAKKTKFLHSIDQYGHLVLEGSLLAIDPSSGSSGSQPGYSLWKDGSLIDSGLLVIHRHGKLHSRLYYLLQALRDNFEQPSVLVTEHIAPFMNSWGATNGVISLHRAIGVIQAAWDVPVLEVPPVTWRKFIPEPYKKNDENDALMIGWTAIREAARVHKGNVPEFSSELLLKLTTDKWRAD